MALIVFSPALKLVDIDQALVNDVVTGKDSLTFLGCIKDVFLCKLKIWISAVVEVWRLPDQQCAHFVDHVVLTAIKIS